MPIGEIEQHPYLEMGQIAGATKLILGSFPVYECTNPDNNIKQEIRERNPIPTLRFFYGSNRNNFWSKYHQYIDNELTHPWNSNSLMASLRNRQISISDLISSCQRIEYSSADKDLRGILWNTLSVRNLINNGVQRILCTSKGVLEHLEKKVICHPANGIGTVNNHLTASLQEEFITTIGGNLELISTPILKSFIINDESVNAIALPSPGAPWRKLRNFGFHGGNWETYYTNYLGNAFNWFVEGN